MELNEDDIFDEDLSGTIFENLGDLPIMSFINEKIRGKYVIYNSNTNIPKPMMMNASPYNQSSITNHAYYNYITTRLGQMVSAKPDADINLLFRIVAMEWNHMCAQQSLKKSKKS